MDLATYILGDFFHKLIWSPAASDHLSNLSKFFISPFIRHRGNVAHFQYFSDGSVIAAAT
jgi:hypothetical protein